MNILNKIMQFFKFGIVGLSNTLISLAVYYIFIFLNVNYLVANMCGYIISSITGYFLNRYWVFSAKKAKVAKSVVRYYIVYGSAFFLNMGLMFLWVDIMNISEVIAPFLTLLITMPYNFLLSKLWVFRCES